MNAAWSRFLPIYFSTILADAKNEADELKCEYLIWIHVGEHICWVRHLYLNVPISTNLVFHRNVNKLNSCALGPINGYVHSFVKRFFVKNLVIFIPHFSLKCQLNLADGGSPVYIMSCCFGWPISLLSEEKYWYRVDGKKYCHRKIVFPPRFKHQRVVIDCVDRCPSYVFC